jgi:hypothetical protein
VLLANTIGDGRSDYTCVESSHNVWRGTPRWAGNAS